MLRQVVRDYGPDALCACGTIAVLHGIAMFYVPAAYIVAGVALVAVGVLKAKR